MRIVEYLRTPDGTYVVPPEDIDTCNAFCADTGAIFVKVEEEDPEPPVVVTDDAEEEDESADEPDSETAAAPKKRGRKPKGEG